MNSFYRLVALGRKLFRTQIGVGRHPKEVAGVDVRPVLKLMIEASTCLVGFQTCLCCLVDCLHRRVSQ